MIQALIKQVLAAIIPDISDAPEEGLARKKVSYVIIDQTEQ